MVKCLLSFSLLCLFSFNAKAGETGSLVLRAMIPPTITTQIKQFQLSSSKSLVTVSSHNNNQFYREVQKVEVEGIDQEGLEIILKETSKNDRTIQYELLIEHLKSSLPIYKPIFLKITAN